MNIYSLACTVCGVVMADGADGGVVDARTWKHVGAIYFYDSPYEIAKNKDSKEKIMLQDYWLYLKKGGLVHCQMEKKMFHKNITMNELVTDTIPIIKVKGKPFLPSGVAC